MTGAMEIWAAGVVLDYIDSYGARRSRVLMEHPSDLWMEGGGERRGVGGRESTGWRLEGLEPCRIGS